MEQCVETWALLESRAFLIGVLHFVIAAAVTAHTLMTKRDVPPAIGWIGMAWLAPILGALLYVGFGINRVKRRARRLKGSVRSVHRVVTSHISSEDPLERLKAAIGNITHQDMTAGKVVAILDCGDQAYPQMLAAIESARFHVRLSTYIFRTDEVGLQFISALAADFYSPPSFITCAGKAFQSSGSWIRRCLGRCRSWICDCIRKVWSWTGRARSSAA